MSKGIEFLMKKKIEVIKGCQNKSRKKLDIIDSDGKTSEGETISLSLLVSVKRTSKPSSRRKENNWLSQSDDLT